jgi:hypothetical protein
VFPKQGGVELDIMKNSFYIAIITGIYIMVFEYRTLSGRNKKEMDFLIHYIVVKKTVIVTTILILILIISSFLKVEIINKYLQSYYIINPIQFYITYVSTLGILALFVAYSNREFWLNICIGSINYMKSIDENLKKDEIKSMKFLLLSIDSYNKYIKRCFNIKIKEIEKVYDIFVSSSSEFKDKYTDYICNSLISNKLGLLELLYKQLCIGKENGQFQFLIKIKKIELSKEISTFIIPVIAVIISLIDLIFKK